ncbi:hypothetical protein BDN70DRAFT_993428 [Pholiota conissans]|uniref:Zn(2)-C6 fungal-type domain-containing protein n=1 Tax=Pholiota conissans TaxID=109636 RepID=A0A9P5Z1H4_9AGAR|nr:hypothetical protein BDN70DRAFT_993428 [Pholiota conissans]
MPSKRSYEMAENEIPESVRVDALTNDTEQRLQKRRKLMKEESPSANSAVSLLLVPEDAENMNVGSQVFSEFDTIPVNEHEIFRRQHNGMELSEGVAQSERASSNSLQHPPVQAHGAFIDNCDGITIGGGKFTQVYGPHTSVIVNFNQPQEAEAEYGVSYQPLSIGPQAQAARHPANEYTSLSSKREPESDSVASSAPNITIYGGRKNSNQIYEQHLELKARGFPLWIPEPSMSLPLPYRRDGVSIGDVGTITPTGGFSFLFNICLPSGHPKNPRELPEGFSPVSLPIEGFDVNKFPEFKAGNFLASASIEKIDDRESQGLSFETTAAEGAILTLPEGAYAYNLENVSKFRTYAIENVESWYRYANGPRGREVKNGDIRLVIGCDKATSWGIAAIANLQQRKHNLKYCPIDTNYLENEGAPLVPTAYKWEYSGLADARVGPDLQEVEELKRDDDSDVAVGGKYLNQCLFIRTLNPTLNEDIFSAMCQELGMSLDSNSQGANSQNNGGPRNSSGRPSSTIFGGDTTMSTQSASNGKERITMSKSLSAPISHPADVLNAVLLRKDPSRRVVITQDDDWCSVICEDDTTMPNFTEIAKRVLATNLVVEEGDAIFLGANRLENTASSSSFSAVPSRDPLVPERRPNKSGQDSQLAVRKMRACEEISTLACLFCRGRKIPCRPLPGNSDKTCNQCQRRSLQCKYPEATARGRRVRETSQGD